MKQPYRTHRGEHFNEGARLLWIAKDARRLSNAALAETAQCGRAQVVKLLYGDLRANRKTAALLEEAFGIPPLSWDLQPAQDFVLPASRIAEESGTELGANESGEHGSVSTGTAG